MLRHSRTVILPRTFFQRDGDCNGVAIRNELPFNDFITSHSDRDCRRVLERRRRTDYFDYFPRSEGAFQRWYGVGGAMFESLAFFCLAVH